MILKRATILLSLALLLSAGFGPLAARAEGPEDAKDGAARIWDLLEKKFKNEKKGEAWLNRKFSNGKWFERIHEREVTPAPVNPPRPPAGKLPTEGLVTDVSDGDTMTVDGVGKIRLQGVDSTEKLHPTKPVQYLSAEASKFTRELILGKRVRLEYGAEAYDKYGRVLAYLYLPDGRMVNLELIKSGLAFSYTRYPHKHSKEFDQAEEQARTQGLGLWADNGLAEYQWLRSQNREDFEVFEMSSNLWGVRWRDLVLLRITTDQMRLELEHLRKDVHTYGPKDLEKELSARGYQKASRGAS